MLESIIKEQLLKGIVISEEMLKQIKIKVQASSGKYELYSIEDYIFSRIIDKIDTIINGGK